MDKELREQIKYKRQRSVGIFLLCLCLGIAVIHLIAHLIVHGDTLFTALTDVNILSLVFLGALAFLTILVKTYHGRVIQFGICVVIATLAVLFSPPLSFTGPLIYIYAIILAVQYDLMNEYFVSKVIVLFTYFGLISAAAVVFRTDYSPVHGVIQFLVMSGFSFLYYLAFANELKSYLSETRKLRAEIDRNKVFIHFGKNVTGIVHNLKSKLNSIEGFNEMLGEKMETDTKADHEILVYQKLAINQMIELVNSLLFAVKAYQLSDFGLVDISRLVKSIVALFQANKKLTGSVSFEMELVEDCEIAISPGILLQVIENLIQNSLEAMVCSEIKSISIKTEIHDEKGEVLFKICDTGCGIQKCTQCDHKVSCIDCEEIKIGETTKKYGSGIGLVYIISALKSMKGRLKIDSEVGKGTCVSLWFPKNSD